MDRRTALKNLTKSIGFAVATPTIMSVLASCSKESNSSWPAHFLSDEEKYIITHLVDIIIPKDNNPGALDVNIPQFIDKMYHDIELKTNKDSFKKGVKYFSAIFKDTHNNSALKGTKEEFETLVTKYFDISDKASKLIFKQQKKAPTKIKNENLESYYIYKFLLSVRYYTIFGYSTSEKVGEEVLAYDPVPGVYNGCISLEEATKGKAWSL